MVKHIIIWKLKDELTDSEKVKIKAEMKEALESLVGKVPGLLALTINTNPLPTSTGDVMLDSTLESEEALKGYSIHPLHVEAANTKVRPFTAQRSCMDFVI